MSIDKSEYYDLIFAMREPYLELLLNGTKTVEVRRTRPSRSSDPYHEWTIREGNKIFLYSRGLIWGHVTISRFAFELNTDYANWVGTAEAACLTTEELVNYLAGSRKPAVYTVSNPVRYASPVRVPCRPQSWQYMTFEIRALLPDFWM